MGDVVKRETQRPGNLLSGEFDPRFDGPFKVKARHSNGVTYILETDAGDELRAHHAQLRLWRIAPAYLRRLEEDGRGRDTDRNNQGERHAGVQSFLPAGGVLLSDSARGVSPGILKHRQRQDQTHQMASSRRSGSAQQTVSTRADDGASRAASRQPAGSSQPIRAASTARRSVRFDDERELPRRSNRIRRPPERWGYS